LTETFNIYDLEISTVIGSKLLLSLEEGVGEYELYDKSKKIISRYFELYSLDKNILNFFLKHKSKFIIEINKDERAYLRDMFERLEENKISEEDVEFLSKLSLNILEMGSHYFILLISSILKVFPSELVSSVKKSFDTGKRLIVLLNDILKDKELDKFTNIFLKEPLPIGIPITNIALDDLKKFFINYGFTPDLFLKVHNILIENFKQRESGDIISLLKNTEITGMDDLRNFNFGSFFTPEDDTLVKLARIISDKASKVKQRLMQKDMELDTKDVKVREETHQFLRKNAEKLQSLVDAKKGNLQELLDKTQEQFNALEKALKLHIRHIQAHEHASKLLKKSIDENKILLTINPEDIKNFFPNPPMWEVEKLVCEFWHELPYLEIVDPSCEKRISKLLKREERLSSNKKVFLQLANKEKRGFSPDIHRVLLNYRRVFRDILEVLYIREVINRMFQIWPPDVDFNNPKSRIIAGRKINLVGLDLLPKGHFYRFRTKGNIRPTVDRKLLEKREQLSTFLRKRFSTLISVLVYDIRGSSFMAHRLRNAKKERSIRNKFQSKMLDTSLKGSPFILKDTGDGGILWFGGNSDKLYRSIYKHRESESGSILRSSTAFEDEFILTPHPKSAEMAINIALNLVKTAEDFVTENYMKYRDWFEEITEKEVFHDGITYALLPPKFKSLFRLGIGIASGLPEKDVIFCPNAFGDPDLTGNIIDEAALFSSGRSPERSVVLIDHCTLINLLLNSDQYLLTLPLMKNDNEKTISDKLLSILKREESEQEIFFENFTVAPVGLYYIDHKDKEKSIEFKLWSNLKLEFNEKGDLSSKRGRVKILYEVMSKEREKNEE
jgi:hypothetical protein